MAIDAAREIELTIAGDDDAFQRIVKTYTPPLSRLAFQIVRDLDGASDIVQEVFIKAHASLPALRDPERLQSWLYGITRTSAIDWLRSRRRDVSAEELVSDGSLEELPNASSGTTVLDTLVADETRQRVLNAIHSLPEHYRDVLLLKYAASLRYENIAERLRLSVPAVESLLFRGRLLLRDRLKTLLDGE